jgi:hypothetical protein
MPELDEKLTLRSPRTMVILRSQPANRSNPSGVITLGLPAPMKKIPAILTPLHSSLYPLRSAPWVRRHENKPGDFLDRRRALQPVLVSVGDGR